MVPTPQGVLTGLSSERNMDILKKMEKTCSCGACTCKDTPQSAPKSKSKDDTPRLEEIVGDLFTMLEPNFKNKTVTYRTDTASTQSNSSKDRLTLLCEKIKCDLNATIYMSDVMQVLRLAVKELANIVKTGESDKQTAFTAFNSAAWSFLTACLKTGKFFTSDVDLVWKSTIALWEEFTKPVNPTRQKDEREAFEAFEAELRRVAYAITTLPKGKNIQLQFENHCRNVVNNIKTKNLLIGLDKHLCMDNLMEVLFVAGFMCGAHNMEEEDFGKIKKLVQDQWRKEPK